MQRTYAGEVCAVVVVQHPHVQTVGLAANGNAVQHNLKSREDQLKGQQTIVAPLGQGRRGGARGEGEGGGGCKRRERLLQSFSGVNMVMTEPLYPKRFMFFQVNAEKLRHLGTPGPRCIFLRGCDGERRGRERREKATEASHSSPLQPAAHLSGPAGQQRQTLVVLVDGSRAGFSRALCQRQHARVCFAGLFVAAEVEKNLFQRGESQLFHQVVRVSLGQEAPVTHHADIVGLGARGEKAVSGVSAGELLAAGDTHGA